MYKTIIIDDEPLAADIIKSYLSDQKDFEISAICQDGFYGLKAIQEHQPDVVFLDIQMPRISGFELLELLDRPPAIIFTTAFDEYAIKAFDNHAIDYLLKPFSKKRFNEALEKFKLRAKAQNIEELIKERAVNGSEYLQRIVLKEKNEIKIITTPQLKFLEANDDFVNIYTIEGKFIKNRTLRFYEQNLDPGQFVRVHRSYIVKVDQITKLENYKKDSYVVRLKSGESIPISKRYPSD